MKRLFLAMSTLCSLAFGQTTWHGLSFGMTRDEIAASLPDFRLVPGDDAQHVHVFGLSPVYEMHGSRYAISFPFNVKLFMGLRSEKLERVTLKLIYPPQGPDEKTNTLAYLVAASEELYAGLKDKYGSPSEEKGSCPISPESLVRGGEHECSATWRDGQQSIEMDQQILMFNANQAPSVDYLVIYSKISSDF